MAQISKIKLDQTIEQGLYNQLWEFLIKAKNSDTASQIYSDLLTETEKLILAKRLAIALLLIRGKNTVQIRERIHVSYSTVITVNAWLKNIRPKTLKLLKEISRSKDWESVMDKLEEILINFHS